MNAVSSSSIGKKIRDIREAEGLTRKEFFELTGIPIKTQTYYETNRREGVGSNILFKITKHPRFKKYTMWLMTDEIESSTGQIAPALAHYGTDGEEAQKQTRKTVEDSDVRSSHYDQKAG
ncbi:helix-turn-helix domain-containing protein [Arsenophonus nasoniae]|uniref:helix-turn-helix domain-containing protein n=1 Tax=Arsenophonus nasoniae TaxID=638 RepID=UPI0038799D2D